MAQSSTSSPSSRRHSTNTTSSRDTRGSQETYESLSTAGTSVHGSPMPSPKALWSSNNYTSNNSNNTRFRPVCEDDISPSTSCHPRSSADTYNSLVASIPEDLDLDREQNDPEAMDWQQAIPPLPAYHRPVENDVQPSTPASFAKLFPSMNRLSIRHDEFTADGNMNLRVDTVVPAGAVPGRRRATNVQLFHLRMYDLAKREFSLRRYCRESGREVCKARRKFADPTAPAEGGGVLGAGAALPALTRSMSSAIKALGAARPGSSSGRRGSAASSGSRGSLSLFGGQSSLRRTTSYSSCDGDDELNVDANSVRSGSIGSQQQQQQKARPVPTNTIKLEFSNYARVDVERKGSKGSKRYEFEWWGHSYAWTRVVDKTLGGVAFHLIRDGTGPPVAHVVPETRSPNQVLVDECAGGWMPPYFMWISDPTVVDAMTDVADVIVATGLMALVDDCIKERWQVKKTTRRRPRLSLDAAAGGSRAFMQHVFGGGSSSRRHSESTPQPSPLRFSDGISAH